MSAKDDLALLKDYLAYRAWRICGTDCPLPEKRSQKHFADDCHVSPSWISATVGRTRKEPEKNQNTWTVLADYFERSLAQAMVEATAWEKTTEARRWRAGEFPLEIPGEAMGRREIGPVDEAARELLTIDKIAVPPEVIRVAKADATDRRKEDWKSHLMRLTLLSMKPEGLPPPDSEADPDPTARPSKESVRQDSKIRTLPGRKKSPR